MLYVCQTLLDAAVTVKVKNNLACPLDCMYLDAKFYYTDENGLNVFKFVQELSIDPLCLNSEEDIESACGVISADVPLSGGKKRLIVSDYSSHSLTEINVQIILALKKTCNMFDRPITQRFLPQNCSLIAHLNARQLT